jgi:hypothetical protein
MVLRIELIDGVKKEDILFIDMLSPLPELNVISANRS